MHQKTIYRFLSESLECVGQFILHLYNIHQRKQNSVDTGHRPLPLSHTSSVQIPNIFTFLDKINIWSVFIFKFKNLNTPLLAKTNKQPKCGVVALLMLTIVSHIHESYRTVEYGALFKKKMTLLYDQKPQTPFFEIRFLGHNSTSNNSVYLIRIF